MNGWAILLSIFSTFVGFIIGGITTSKLRDREEHAVFIDPEGNYVVRHFRYDDGRGCYTTLTGREITDEEARALNKTRS